MNSFKSKVIQEEQSKAKHINRNTFSMNEVNV